MKIAIIALCVTLVTSAFADDIVKPGDLYLEGNGTLGCRDKKSVEKAFDLYKFYMPKDAGKMLDAIYVLDCKLLYPFDDPKGAERGDHPLAVIIKDGPEIISGLTQIQFKKFGPDDSPAVIEADEHKRGRIFGGRSGSWWVKFQALKEWK